MNLKIKAVTISSFFLFGLLNLSGVNSETHEKVKIAEKLEVKRLTENTYLYTSFMDFAGMTNIPCNGLIYLKDGKAVIMSSPHNQKITQQLVNWVKKDLKAEVKAAFMDHFHEDGGYGGIKTYHKEKIPTYASIETVKMLKQKKRPLPFYAFKDQASVNISGETVLFRHLGPAHTPDGSVAWIPSDKVLFGGCMIKEVKAKNLGNLEDADISNYAGTVRKVKEAFDEVQVVVPGHGNTGGIEVLDHTINLAEQLKNK